MFTSEPLRGGRGRLAAVSVLPLAVRIAGALLLSLAAGATALAESGTKALLERALAAEAESVSILLDHYRLEDELLSPDVDRLTVLLSIPAGRAADIEQVQLLVDASRKSPVLGKLPDDRPLTVPLYLERVGQGAHTLQLDLRLGGGRGIVSQGLRVDKAGAARFVEFRLEGERNPRLVARQW